MSYHIVCFAKPGFASGDFSIFSTRKGLPLTSREDVYSLGGTSRPQIQVMKRKKHIQCHSTTNEVGRLLMALPEVSAVSACGMFCFAMRFLFFLLVLFCLT